MEQLVDRVIHDLQALREHLPELAKAKDRIKAAEADLSALENAHKDLQSQFDGTRAKLSDAQFKAQRDYDVELQQKGQRMQALNQAIAAAEEKLKHLESTINSRRLEHDQILASMDSLRKRLG